MKSTEKSLINLTWDDLRQWAGGKILNRGKSYVKNVSGLARTDDGAWAAWVAGSEEYATTVDADGHGEIDWHCTCPFDWGPCKHAVAVILAGIEEVKAGREMPLLEDESDLYLALWEDPYETDDIFFDEDDFDEESPGKKGNESGMAKTLQKKSREELLDMLIGIASRHPQVRREIIENEQLAGGQVDKLVRALRREIKNITGEEAWYSHWSNEGNLPDYSHIKKQLIALLKNGHADAVVELGRELWERGNDQVGQSDDDGHTAEEIHQCMEIVFKAIAASSLSAPKRILTMIDIFLGDEYSICDSFARFVRREEYSQAHWREVAAQLRQRLAAMPNPKGAGFSDRYRREHLMDWLVDAYKRSGQREKIIPLFEKEVHATRCYEKLVKAYLDSGRPEEARSWCVKGFNETIKDMPGIAHVLRDKLLEMAVKEKEFDLVASYRAEEFFDRPCRAGYIKLQKAAEKIKLWPDVRTAALRFLEEGERPGPSSKKKKEHEWPLPPPEVAGKTISRRRDLHPDLDTLIDIAILEKRFDDVVRLYREQRKGSRWGIGMGEEVADAVAASHPDVALDIWKRIVVGKIKLVKPREYEEAAVYLRKMRKVYQKTERSGEWQALIASLRTEHKAKRRLMEVLDSLEGKRIID